MTIQAPFQSLDYGFLMDDFNHNFQFQQQIPMGPESSVSTDPLLASLIDRQSKEIDRYVQQQSNLLRLSIQQQSKQQIWGLLRGLEFRAAAMMRRKEEEVAVVESRVAQLEACLARLEQDREAWESAAREQEAVAASLNKVLDQLQGPCLSSTGRGEEVNSSSAGKFGCCRVCGTRDSRMLLLPCRHLCCCDICDAALETCPVCRLAKGGSVEVFLA